MPASTVHAVLTRCRINRLTHIDRTTGEPIRRYEHDRPGAVLHVDVSVTGKASLGSGWWGQPARWMSILGGLAGVAGRAVLLGQLVLRPRGRPQREARREVLRRPALHLSEGGPTPELRDVHFVQLGVKAFGTNHQLLVEKVHRWQSISLGSWQV